MTDVSVRPDSSRGEAGGGPAGPAAEDPLREELLRAAAAVFARQGYAGARIMDVVRESGLSTGAVYGRFRSKNDLLREAVVTRSANAANHLDTGSIDRVAELIERAATRTGGPLADSEALRLEAYVTARRDPEVAAALAEANAAWKAAMVPLVDEALRDGTIAGDVDPDCVLFLVRILNLGLLLHRGSGLAGPDPDAWADLVARIVASFGAPAPPGGAAAPPAPAGTGQAVGPGARPTGTARPTDPAAPAGRHREEER